MGDLVMAHEPRFRPRVCLAGHSVQSRAVSGRDRGGDGWGQHGRGVRYPESDRFNAE